MGFVKKVYHMKKTRYCQILEKAPEERFGEYLFGGQIGREVTYVILLIPLWFNIHTHALFFTRKGVIFATWSFLGLKDPVFIGYDVIEKITYRTKKAFISGTCELTVYFGGTFSEFGGNPHFIRFFIENAHIIKECAPHVVIRDIS